MIEEKDNMVVHPAHYNFGKFETKDIQKIILNFLKPAPYISLCIGDAIKYIDRYGKKWQTRQELEKAKEYLMFCDYCHEKEKIEKYIDLNLSQGFIDVVEWFQLKRVLDCLFNIFVGNFDKSLEYWNEIREESEQELGIFKEQL